MSTYIACHASRIVAYCMETPKVFAFPHLVSSLSRLRLPTPYSWPPAFWNQVCSICRCWHWPWLYRAFISFCHQGGLEEEGREAYKQPVLSGSILRLSTNLSGPSSHADVRPSVHLANSQDQEYVTIDATCTNLTQITRCRTNRK